MASYPVPVGSNGLAFVGLTGVGSTPVQPGAVFGKLRLPTDPIGTFALTLTNVITGSAIQIESTSGVTLHNSTAGAETVAVNLSCYAAGSPLNDLRVKVRKGSASPFYQPWQTFATAIVGSQTIYVSQIPDE